MTKTLYLHIGFGKTGSSAVQNWLREVAPSLLEAGILYPDATAKEPQHKDVTQAEPAYNITSGNGRVLKSALTHGHAGRLLDRHFAESPGVVLYSSEGFQGLAPPQLRELCDLSRDRAIRVVIIAFIRNLYEATYSDYQQRLKGRLLDKSFREFCLARDGSPQIKALKKFEEYFEDIRLVHYDSEKLTGLDLALLRNLKVDKPVAPMAGCQVNRSLTALESELMRWFNKQYLSLYPNARRGANGPGRTLSDALISQNPEASPELLLDDPALEHLHRLHAADVDRINGRYFQDQRLKILGPVTRDIQREPHELPEAVRIFVAMLVQQSASLFPQPTPGEPNQGARQAGPKSAGAETTGKLSALATQLGRAVGIQWR